MARIRIGTDSTADIPQELCRELEISVLPLTISAGKEEYRDGVDITPQEFYPVLDAAEELPMSSAVTPFQYMELYTETWKLGYTDLIQVCLNAKGSSTYQNAVQTRDMFYAENPAAKDALRIHLIDSGTYSMGYGLPVVEAARMAKEGKDAEQIIAYVQDWVEHSRPLFVPLSLRCVKRSGRVSAASAIVGDMLGIRPAFTFENGASKTVAKFRGDKKAIRGVIDIVRKERKPGSAYALVYGNNPEVYQAFKEAVVQALEQLPEVEYPVGCIIAINTGPDMFAIIYRI